MPDSQAVAIQACKHCGTGAPPDAHFCPKCEKILSLARHGDYFAFLGLPRKLAIDLQDLDRRLRTLSRQFHPDYYCNATASERLASLERASYLNDAYRTLRDPAARVEYLLEIEGVPLKHRGGTTNGVSPQLLEEVFELNEQLDAIRAARQAGAPDADTQARLATARVPVDRHLADHARRLDDLARRWDTLIDQGVPRAARRPVLDALKTLLLERNYITNLLAALEKEAAEQGTA
jgi:molecular chaperone HscB